MAAMTDPGLAGEMLALLRGSRWEQAALVYEKELSPEEREEPDFKLLHAIALVGMDRLADGLKMLDRSVLALPNARGDLRRFAISPLCTKGRLADAVQLLDRLLETNPDQVEDRFLRASLLSRLGRRDEAFVDAEEVLRQQPDDEATHAWFIQMLIQAKRLEDAGAHAERLGLKAADHPRLAAMALQALIRSGRVDQAAELAHELSTHFLTEESTAGAIVRALFEAGRFDEAVDVGERLIVEGWEHALLRSSLGQAYMQIAREDRYEKAIEHLRAGLALEPRDARMNATMGEALLRNRNYEVAIPYLERACELQPKLAQARALYARALKQAGRYDEAAREFRQLLALQPSSPRWQRYAAGALSQAGRRREAAELFDAFVADRRKALPSRFDEGLRGLWNKVDSLDLPRPRLDWAWSLSDSHPDDRADWERRAKWGHLADHYLLDWLECRDDRVADAMMKLADLGPAERALKSVDSGAGMILASAHIGPMYAGPLALELMGIKSRWLASTPSVARTAYAGSLISTSDQDDMEVARQFMLSLRSGYSVVIAVDGAINLAAPRIPFEGQEVTYSSFAARTAHKLAIPSAFCAPRWEGERIGFVVERLPDPVDGEGVEAFSDRWREAFFDSLRRYLGGEPENLRLSGGIWRHIR